MLAGGEGKGRKKKKKKQSGGTQLTVASADRRLPTERHRTTLQLTQEVRYRLSVETEG